MERGFKNGIVAALAIPDKTVLFAGSSAPLHDQRPRPFASARRVGGVAREKEHFARVNRGHCALLIRRHVVEVERSFQLVEDFIARVDVEVSALVGASRYKSDEIGVFPNRSSLAPVMAVFIDPLPQIKFPQVRKHKASIATSEYSRSGIGNSIRLSSKELVYENTVVYLLRKCWPILRTVAENVF